MPLDFGRLVDPAHTALVICDLQQGLVGEGSSIPGLAEVVRDKKMIQNAARLLDGAHAAGVGVVHCLDVRRPDRRGASRNGALFHFLERSSAVLLEGSPAAGMPPEIDVHESDVVLRRLHGLSAFHDSELDTVLRSGGVTTVVCAGVSVNIGVTNLVFDGVNRGYQMVVPEDAVAGYPADYERQVFENSLRGVSTLTRVDALLEAWPGA